MEIVERKFTSIIRRNQEQKRKMQNLVPGWNWTWQELGSRHELIMNLKYQTNKELKEQVIEGVPK